MNSKIILIPAFVICICLFSSAVYAQTLEVEKLVETNDIKAGDDVTVLLKFKNNFNENVKIQIVDKNIFANNGLDIQCYEHTLPPGTQVIAYEPIKPFSSGNYTLDEAAVKYTNPLTGKEDEIKSNKLELEVKAGQQMQGQAQSITTIYQCGGMSMRSTQTTSSQQQNQQQQNNQQKQQSPDDKIQNNQMNQNTQGLKQEIQKEMQRQEKMKEEFMENIRNNSDFKKMSDELLGQNYTLNNSKINPLSNDSGEFEFDYDKGNKTASIRGRMENGTMSDLMSQSDEDREKMLNELMESEEFKKYNEKLEAQGFNMSGVNFTQVSQNHTKIEVSYKNNSMGNESNSTNIRKITAEYKDGEIKNVVLEDNENNKNENLWLILILLLILIASGVYYFKFIKKEKQREYSQAPEPGKNYLEEAREMLNAARDLFGKKKEKDAYEKVSQAVRFYFSNKLNLKKEVTNYELLKVLERDDKGKEVKRCLDLCALVEFAKYRANREDFDEIILSAEKIISG